MPEFEGLSFRPLTAEDVPVLTPIMKRAFDDDSRRFFQNPVGGPPGYDDGSFLRKWGLQSGSEAYRIDEAGRPVGAVILFVHPSGREGTLGCVFIDPERIGHGLGTKVWRFVEQSHPQVRVWNTETPAVSYRNHRFYVNKCGFHVVAVEGDEDRYEAQFRLRKELPQR